MVVVNEKKKQLTTDAEGQPQTKETLQEQSEPQEKQHLIIEELEKERAKSDDYLRRLQYLQADFENYRKRVEKEMSDNRQYGNQRLLSDLIIVNDELELALRKAEETKESPTITEGLRMVHKRLHNLLSKEGIEKIQALGARFNPEIHDAALRVESDEEDGTVIEEIRQGYTLKGKVLRPSIVKVASNPAEREPKSERHELEEYSDNEQA
jgi:molecular chaperone GrpE